MVILFQYINQFFNDNFIENISNRIIETINNNKKQKPLPDEFSCDRAIEKEVGIYNLILKKL